MPNNVNDIRSEDVQEILSAVPNWMIRWGNLLILLLIIMLLGISWFVKYPDIITAEAMITTKLPPQKEFAKTTGTLIAVLVADNEIVSENQPLAIIENTANYKDVYVLKSIIDSVTINNHSFEFSINSLPILFLGDIESQYALFENSYIDYKLNSKSKKLNIKNLDYDHSKTEMDLINIELVLFKKMIQSFNNLKLAIKKWENQYVLKSNINGKVSFLNNWRVNQTLSQGDLIFTIIPSKNSAFIAKVKSPTQNFGKIKIGQTVNISLEIYPETEFGTLQGTINYISPLPNQEGLYLMDVALPETLVTSYNKTFEFRQEMSGMAEIVTEDLRLIERFFYQFKNTLNR